MNRKKITVLLSFCLILTFVFASCGNVKDNETGGDVVSSSTQAQTSANETESQTDVSETESETTETEALSSEETEDDDVSIDTYIVLNDANTTVNGTGASFSDSVVTITEPGTYSLSGSLSNGKIYINTSSEDKKVKLYLNGVDITCQDDAPIFVENCPKETIIILAAGSVNNLTDSADRTVPDDENADYATAVIYSKDDLQIEGSGTLNVNALWNKGIFTKNDLDIRGGIINITSVDDGIRGKDSVEISDGILTIDAGGDGIRTSEEEEEDKGFILISGGTFNIKSELDAIQAITDIDITGGTFNIVSCGGSTGTVQQSEDFGMGMAMNRQERNKSKGGGFFPNDSSYEETSENSSVSAKGIKAGKTLTIEGGSFTVSSPDDTVHGTDILVNGGTFSLESDDDGIHADNNLTINDGNIDITFSYEGLEAAVITINGGTTTLVAEDDGLNASTGSTTESQGGRGGRGGMGGMMDYQASCQFYMNGGYLFMDADGDGLDSNGDATVTGGTIVVFGPTNSGNGALDYAGNFNMSGGTLLAVGASGMAQSVSKTSDKVQVLAFNCSTPANTLLVITDEKDNAIIGIQSPKSYQTIIFATDTIDKSDSYNVYSGGSFDSESVNGVYISGNYTLGELLGTLTK